MRAWAPIPAAAAVAAARPALLAVLALIGAAGLSTAAAAAAGPAGVDEGDGAHTAAAAAAEELPLLGQDDECLADEPASLCGLSALQLRASPSSPASPAAAVAPPPPALCDEALVALACERINRLTPEFFGTSADNDLSVVHAAELAEQLMVSRRSVLDYLQTHLRASNVEVDRAALSHDAFAVRCTELCNLTVLSFPASYRPPTSDVGCYVPSGSSMPKCDIDVSPVSLGGFRFDDHNPEEAESKFAESPSRQGNLSYTATHRPNTTAELRALKDLDYPYKGMKQLGIAVANLFRVYPLSPIGAVGLKPGRSEKAESAVEVGSEVYEYEDEDDELDPNGYWDDLRVSDDSDEHASMLESNATCAKDTGGTCMLFGCMGWRKADCQNRKCVCGAGKCASMFGQCVDQADLANSVSIDSFSNSLLRRRRDPATGRRRWAQNVFHGGVDTKNWKDHAKTVGVKAQAYTAGALRNMNAGLAKPLMLKWFGMDDAGSQKEMRRVVNGVHDMLSNVDYVYPGTKCQPNVYAYVYPNPPNNKNSRGQYVIHLCDLYIKSSLEEEIETLTHEGSHHHTMSLLDVCAKGDGPSCTRAYGRQTCEQLAKSSPNLALKNADSFCFFINDAYEGGRDEVKKLR